MKKNFRNLKILVTGGDGFIGSHLVNRLVYLGARVFCLVKPHEDLWRIGDLKGKIRVFERDICERHLVKELKKINPDKVFHLASVVNAERDLSIAEEMFRVNLGGTRNLMIALKNLDCDAIVNTGTCEEYGNSKAPFREIDVPCPVSPYSASKAAGTFYCQMLYRSFRMPITTLRPFLTYGPKQSGKLFIPSIIKAALKGEDFYMTRGDQTREFNYVSDIVEGFLKAGTSVQAVGKVINLGCGEDYKIIDVARKVLSIIGAGIRLKTGRLPYREGEVKRFYCDNSLAKKILRWKPRVKLEEGLRRTIGWYKKESYLN